jgi:hypothetical protein
VKEEENEIFEKVGDKKEELDELGQQMASRKAELAEELGLMPDDEEDSMEAGARKRSDKGSPRGAQRGAR